MLDLWVYSYLRNIIRNVRIALEDHVKYISDENYKLDSNLNSISTFVALYNIITILNKLREEYNSLPEYYGLVASYLTYLSNICETALWAGKGVIDYYDYAQISNILVDAILLLHYIYYKLNNRNIMFNEENYDKLKLEIEWFDRDLYELNKYYNKHKIMLLKNFLKYHFSDLLDAVQRSFDSSDESVQNLLRSINDLIVLTDNLSVDNFSVIRDAFNYCYNILTDKIKQSTDDKSYLIYHLETNKDALELSSAILYQTV